MTSMKETQGELFGAPEVRCEYYPVLLPDNLMRSEIAGLNTILVEEFGLKQSQLTKMPHISINGVTCPEDDLKVLGTITTFLSTQNPFTIEFSEVGYFPGRGGITLKLGVQNPQPLVDFDRLFMTAINGKITKLNLHLTLARYVDRALFESLQNPGIIYPKSCVCSSVAVLKKCVGEKGAYRNIGVVEFGG